jgi:hypothetical protein
MIVRIRKPEDSLSFRSTPFFEADFLPLEIHKSDMPTSSGSIKGGPSPLLEAHKSYAQLPSLVDVLVSGDGEIAIFQALT